MNQTVTSLISWGGKQGLEISRREDRVFLLRTWHDDGLRVKADAPIYLTLTEMERVFDDIGQALVRTGMSELTEIMEAM